MYNLKFIPLSVIAFLLCACQYNGKLETNLYKQKDFRSKQDLKILVVNDKYQKEFFLLDDPYFEPYQKFKITLDDAVAANVADAMATLFTDVKTDSYDKRYEYDYIVEPEFFPSYETQLRFMLPRSHRSFRLRWYLLPTFTTTLRLTIRNPHTGQPVAMYQEEHFSKITFSIFSQVLNGSSLLSFGLLTPLQLQSIGNDLKTHLEDSLALLLKKIIRQIEQDKALFTQDHQKELLPRVDGAYEPFLKAVVTIINANDSSKGSGFFISPNGYILTNAHVVKGARDVQIILYDDPRTDINRLHPKKHFAKVVGRNTSRDLALLKIEGENYPWLLLEPDRNQYKTGSQVFAAGSPMGLFWSVTKGVISSVRNVDGADQIQTDTSINAGNSGGPLILQESGKVIGVNTHGIVKNIGEGLNFAISAFEVYRTLGISQPITQEQINKLEESNFLEQSADEKDGKENWPVSSIRKIM